MSRAKVRILSFVGILLVIAFLVELLTAKPGLFEVFLYVVLGMIGSVVYLKKTTSVKKLGVISLMIGFTLEFTIMRPDWVQAFFGQGSLTMDKVPFPVVLNIIYWFSLWAVPAHVLNRLG